jgi:hypothetical protein
MSLYLQYRLTISINFEDADKTYGSVIIEDVTNHYE